MDVGIIGRSTLKPLMHFYNDFVIFVSCNKASAIYNKWCQNFKLNIFGKKIRFQSIQDQHKRNFSSRLSRLLSYQYVVEFDPSGVC